MTTKTQLNLIAGTSHGSQYSSCGSGCDCDDGLGMAMGNGTVMRIGNHNYSDYLGLVDSAGSRALAAYEHCKHKSGIVNHCHHYYAHSHTLLNTSPINTEKSGTEQNVVTWNSGRLIQV